MKIIRQWNEFKRWSAHDSDHIFYVEVEENGQRHTFEEIGKPMTDEKIEKRLHAINNPAEYHVAYAKRLIESWPDWKKKIYYDLLRQIV